MFFQVIKLSLPNSVNVFIAKSLVKRIILLKEKESAKNLILA